MNFEFDEMTDMVEFGVCVREQGNIVFFDVPIDVNVTANLREMAHSTWDRLNGVADTPAPYDPAAESRGRQHISLPIDDGAVELLRDVNEADRFDPGGGVLISQPRRVFCYFARFTDGDGNRMTGMRQSKEFKGILGHRNRLARIVNDTLRMTQDSIFKLDTDFDLLIGSDEVRVLRPIAFEIIGSLQEAIRAAVPQNTLALQESLGFVDFGPIEEFAKGNVSAARLLAAIRNKETDGITVESLVANCERNGTKIEVGGSGIIVEPEAMLGFLRTLNRSRFNVELIPGQVEAYDASGTKRL